MSISMRTTRPCLTIDKWPGGGWRALRCECVLDVGWWDGEALLKGGLEGAELLPSPFLGGSGVPPGSGLSLSRVTSGSEVSQGQEENWLGPGRIPNALPSPTFSYTSGCGGRVVPPSSTRAALQLAPAAFLWQRMSSKQSKWSLLRSSSFARGRRL